MSAKMGPAPPGVFNPDEMRLWTKYRERWAHLTSAMHPYLVRYVQLANVRREAWTYFRQSDKPPAGGPHGANPDPCLRLVLQLDRELEKLRILMGLEPDKGKHPEASTAQGATGVAGTSPPVVKRPETQEKEGYRGHAPGAGPTGAEPEEVFRLRTPKRPPSQDPKGYDPEYPGHTNVLVKRKPNGSV